MEEAIVKIWKGQYGFATLKSGYDVFIHTSDIKNRNILMVDDRVSLEIEKTDKGLKGTNVVVIED